MKREDLFDVLTEVNGVYNEVDKMIDKIRETQNMLRELILRLVK